MRTRFLLVHNKLAGVSRRRMLERTCAALEAHGAALSLEHADSVEDDARIARRAATAGDFDAVVAVGGDSTVRGVAAGLAGTAMPLGIVPAGTGNVLAEEIGLAREPDAVADCLMRGPAAAIFGGVANGQTFYEMAGAGFDARVLSHLDIGLKQRLGKLAYAWPILAELAHRQPRFEIDLDGARYPCTWAIVCKASRYAGGFLLAAQQRLAAEDFHAVVVDARSRASLLGVLLALAAGRIGAHPAVTIVRCRSARIAPSEGVALQIDGEPIGGAALQVTKAEAPVRLIVPTGHRVD